MEDDALAALVAGIGRLRGVESATGLLARAADEVRRTCDFERAIVYALGGGRARPVSVSPAAVRAEPLALDDHADLGEVVRRRSPALVEGAAVVPLQPRGRVIGVVQAGPAGTDAQLQLLAAFSESFALAYDRAVLHGRLRDQRDRVHGLVDETRQLTMEILAASAELERLDRRATDDAVHDAARIAFALPDAGQTSLTPRELEIVRLLARGETNAAIADRLVISQGTVKTHVARILRKLGASNRAEAVSRFLSVSTST